MYYFHFFVQYSTIECSLVFWIQCFYYSALYVVTFFVNSILHSKPVDLFSKYVQISVWIIFFLKSSSKVWNIISYTIFYNTTRITISLHQIQSSNISYLLILERKFIRWNQNDNEKMNIILANTNNSFVIKIYLWLHILCFITFIRKTIRIQKFLTSWNNLIFQLQKEELKSSLKRFLFSVSLKMLRLDDFFENIEAKFLQHIL